MKLSVVIPFYNEEQNVDFVLKEVSGVLWGMGCDSEIIAIDDGSKDRTAELLKESAQAIKNLRILTHPRNCGQAAAMWTGFENVTGDVVVTLDGDRQNDFRDVPKLLPLLEKYDAVLGQRVERRDPLQKRVASRIGNFVRDAFLKDGVRDSACGIKVMKKATLKYILPVEGFQRFVPFMLKEAGVPFIAVPVNHRPRQAGASKFLLLKFYFLPTIVDLLFMWWFKRQNLFRRRR